jgi:hypothetical protein
LQVLLAELLELHMESLRLHQRLQRSPLAELLRSDSTSNIHSEHVSCVHLNDTQVYAIVSFNMNSVLRMALYDTI